MSTPAASLPALVTADVASAAAGACRNCGAATTGDAYCPHCGQETRIALPTARQFMREAAGRYVSLDGRMWRTLYSLMFRPGFLTLEYIGGRRRRYVRPGRLFLVTSILAFATIHFAIRTPQQLIVTDRDVASKVQQAIPAAPTPPVARKPATSSAPAPGSAPTASATSKKRANAKDDMTTFLSTDDYQLSMDHDFNLRLGGAGTSGRIPGALRERLDHFNRLPREDKGAQLFANMVRYGPYAAIALLPAFALLLMLVYPWRSARYRDRPRQFAAHLVFAAHNHAFSFLLTIILLLLPSRSLAAFLLMIAAAIYLLQSMRNVYGGGWVLTLMRAFVLMIGYVLMFALVTSALLVAAVVLQ